MTAAPVPPDVADRLRRWVRTALGLDHDAAVTITQLDGDGPVETVLAVRQPGEVLHRTVAAPAEYVSVADVQRAFGLAA